jgi:hypothetical protein
MPLRPVSDLGLVDVTDLTSRETGGTATRRSTSEDLRSAGATKAEKSSTRSEQSGPRTPRSSPSTGAAGSKSASRPKDSSGGPGMSARAPKSSEGSGETLGSARGSTAGADRRRRRPRPQSELNRDSREMQSAVHDDQTGDETKGALANVGISVLTGAVGVAGGVLLARTALQRQRKVLGIPLPRRVDLELGGVGKRIGEASRQFGKLTGGVRSVRERTEQIGHALS